MNIEEQQELNEQLLNAVAKNNFGGVKACVSRGADVNHCVKAKQSSLMVSPLLLALDAADDASDTEIMTYLLDEGAEVDMILAENQGCVLATIAGEYDRYTTENSIPLLDLLLKYDHNNAFNLQKNVFGKTACDKLPPHLKEKYRTLSSQLRQKAATPEENPFVEVTDTTEAQHPDDRVTTCIKNFFRGMFADSSTPSEPDQNESGLVGETELPSLS